MKKLQLGDLTLFGQSKAGFHTGIMLQEPRIAFDLGALHPVMMGCSDVFISHTHTDHIGQIFNYLSQRCLLGCDVATFYVPPSAGEPLLNLLQQWAAFSRTPIDFRVFAVSPQTPIMIKNQYRVTSFPLDHTLETFGYLVERISRRLKPQFQQLPSGDIQRLRLESPDEIFRSEAVPIFAYVPDTLASALPTLPEAVWRSRVLALECTWIYPVPEERRLRHAHVVLDELVPYLEKFQGDHVLLFHFSAAYSKEEVLTRIREVIPEPQHSKINILMDGD